MSIRIICLVAELNNNTIILKTPFGWEWGVKKREQLTIAELKSSFHCVRHESLCDEWKELCASDDRCEDERKKRLESFAQVSTGSIHDIRWRCRNVRWKCGSDGSAC